MTSTTLSFSLLLLYVFLGTASGSAHSLVLAGTQGIDPEKPLHTSPTGGGGIKPPKLILSAPAQYTADAVNHHIEGVVEIYTWVNTDGTTSHVRPARGIGYGLDQSAVDAVRYYRYQPAEYQGKPVLVDMYVDVVFKLP